MLLWSTCNISNIIKLSATHKYQNDLPSVVTSISANISWDSVAVSVVSVDFCWFLAWSLSWTVDSGAGVGFSGVDGSRGGLSDEPTYNNE